MYAEILENPKLFLVLNPSCATIKPGKCSKSIKVALSKAENFGFLWAMKQVEGKVITTIPVKIVTIGVKHATP